MLQVTGNACQHVWGFVIQRYSRGGLDSQRALHILQVVSDGLQADNDVAESEAMLVHQQGLKVAQQIRRHIDIKSETFRFVLLSTRCARQLPRYCNGLTWPPCCSWGFGCTSYSHCIGQLDAQSEGAGDVTATPDIDSIDTRQTISQRRSNCHFHRFRSTTVRANTANTDTSTVESPRVPGAVLASAVASGLGTACLSPNARPALISFLSTHAASQLVRDLMEKHPELHVLKPLELLAFMTAVGWIYYSAVAHAPHSQVRAVDAVHGLRAAGQYRLGLNPNPCVMRHKGMTCNQFARSDFLSRVTSEAFRLYFPVHFSAWLLAQRHAKVRARPVSTRLRRFAAKLLRSTAYFTTFVYVGWVLSCHMGKFGDRSLTHRKLQFFLGGALPSLAIFIESPSRRRPIGLILTSYVLVSMGNVAFRRIPWLQPGASPVRGVLEAGCAAAAVAATISASLESNHLIRRILLGDIEARALQHQLKEAEPKAELAENEEPSRGGY
ncbi:Transmembrane protein [Phytophthora cactorum]|nr:Transmembrane protein [Phytophthora cactorum]